MFAAPCLPERFWQKVVKTADGCWVWVGALDTNGYGLIWNGERVVGAHRLAYEVMVGPVPEGLVLDHEVCSLPCCVNPAHLVPKTNKANILRGDGPPARNARKTHCPRGHELVEGNLYDHGRGARDCRRCAIDRAKARHESQR